MYCHADDTTDHKHRSYGKFNIHTKTRSISIDLKRCYDRMDADPRKDAGVTFPIRRAERG
jgi:hypothetical protein